MSSAIRIYGLKSGHLAGRIVGEMAHKEKFDLTIEMPSDLTAWPSGTWAVELSAEDGTQLASIAVTENSSDQLTGTLDTNTAPAAAEFVGTADVSAFLLLWNSTTNDLYCRIPVALKYNAYSGATPGNAAGFDVVRHAISAKGGTWKTINTTVDVHTVPVGKRDKPMRLTPICDAVSGSGTKPTLTLTVVSGATLLSSRTINAVTANGDAGGWTFDPGVWYAAGTIFRVTIDGASTYTTHTGRFILQYEEIDA